MLSSAPSVMALRLCRVAPRRPFWVRRRSLGSSKVAEAGTERAERCRPPLAERDIHSEAAAAARQTHIWPGAPLESRGRATTAARPAGMADQLDGRTGQAGRTSGRVRVVRLAPQRGRHGAERVCLSAPSRRGPSEVG